MLLKRDLLENVTIISCSGTVVCLILNYISNISPITGIYFIIYILLLFITSLFASFKLIQWLLHLNKPIQYDIEKLVEKYPFMAFLADVLPKFEKKTEKEIKEYDTNELSVITSVLEKRLVSSWYVPYISEEIGFPFACKQTLDQIIAKAFETCNKIDNKDIFVDMCAILTSHFKEYKRALKRHETSPNETVESLYKKTHPIFNSKNKKTATADHCIDVLRIILKDLVPWEVWDTPYSELLVRILAKKLDTYIDTTIANPIWLNDKLLNLLTKEKATINTDSIEKEPKNVETVKDVAEKKESIEKSNENIIVESTQEVKKVVQNVEEKTKVDLGNGSEFSEVKPVLRQRRGRQGRSEVKIYDRIIEGSVKTWETDMDLQCISVGQDLLASLDEMTLSRLWGQEDAEHSPNMRTVSPQPLWFGEEDNVELDLDLVQSKKDSSPKPAELLRDLQSTVHQAKAKIGDLQDEAAGMMEGLLDKGIAGIKKGLRFTGLSDDSQEKHDKSPAHKGSEKVSPELQRHRLRTEISEAQEAYTTMGTPKEDNLMHHLVKQQRVSSQDSVLSRAPAWCPSPPAAPPSPPTPRSKTPPSPEPQYEEAADLSASIAKLRSLLQHAGPRPEEVWWEGAEETRGRQATNITRPPDAAALADEYDMERNASPGQTSNNMQRLDKLFTRTVTGVFNSIRTAVGAEGEVPAGGSEGGGALADWTYVSTSPELSVCSAAGRLVGSRRALWHVDSALDSLHQLETKDEEKLEPLELEEWLCAYGSRWAGLLEVVTSLGLVSSHLAFRLSAVLCADIAESLIATWLDELSGWLKKQVFVYFEQLAANSEADETPLRELDVDETCRIILENIPEWCVVSEERARVAVRTCVCSMQHACVLKDVLYRMIDALAGRARAAGGQH
ncbi:uncharacterized protein LOC116774294 isoform X2 [Danaus plexippus]|uniref:uncharacterized protein LOC116774294 isoform X2 n=1 Tax=Danaus plexippus TaxID=13037 RepID=UPI002AB1A1DA|nr:uncharacterized protein LOC116774294 isoform X2 [Danaus plexippus]